MLYKSHGSILLEIVCCSRNKHLSADEQWNQQNYSITVSTKLSNFMRVGWIWTPLCLHERAKYNEFTCHSRFFYSLCLMKLVRRRMTKNEPFVSLNNTTQPFASQLQRNAQNLIHMANFGFSKVFDNLVNGWKSTRTVARQTIYKVIQSAWGYRFASVTLNSNWKWNFVCLEAIKKAGHFKLVINSYLELEVTEDRLFDHIFPPSPKQQKRY